MSYETAPRGARADTGDAWQRQLIEDLARDALIERRRSRRWQIFFRSLAIVLLFLGETMELEAARLAVAGFLAGVLCFLLALLCFLMETVLATRLLNFPVLKK